MKPVVDSYKGPFKWFITFFPGNLTPPPRNANNVEPYTFVTLFSGKPDTLKLPLCYVTLKWPLVAENEKSEKTTCITMARITIIRIIRVIYSRFLCGTSRDPCVGLFQSHPDDGLHGPHRAGESNDLPTSDV